MNDLEEFSDDHLNGGAVVSALWCMGITGFTLLCAWAYFGFGV